MQDGILHEIWLGNPDTRVTKSNGMGAIRPYGSYPTFIHIIEDFTAKSNHAYYVERFTSYFLAPESGDYIFTIECPNVCVMNFQIRYKIPIKLFDITGG